MIKYFKKTLYILICGMMMVLPALSAENEALGDPYLCPVDAAGNKQCCGDIVKAGCQAPMVPGCRSYTDKVGNMKYVCCACDPQKKAECEQPSTVSGALGSGGKKWNEAECKCEGGDENAVSTLPVESTVSNPEESTVTDITPEVTVSPLESTTTPSLEGSLSITPEVTVSGSEEEVTGSDSITTTTHTGSDSISTITTPTITAPEGSGFESTTPVSGDSSPSSYETTASGGGG